MKKSLAFLLIVFLLLPYPALAWSDSLLDELQVEGLGFVDLLVQGEFARAAEQFSSPMLEAMPPGDPGENLQAIWSNLLRQVGSFKRKVGVRTETDDNYCAVLVTCEFTATYLDVRVVYDRQKEVSGLFFQPAQTVYEYEVPDYVDQESFTEKEVTVGDGKWALPGTLTVPCGEGPFPAVVLVHGSGPNDRNLSLGPNRAFQDLAWGLASRGIVVLRYDKRTFVHGEKIDALSLTVQEEAIDDAVLAVELLRGFEFIQQDRIFVLGLSLGGMLIPRIGREDTEICGFIVMAGPARPLEELILEQVTYLLSLDGELRPADKEQIAKVEEQVNTIQGAELSPDIPPEDLLGFSAHYWLDLRGYNPPEKAKELERPLLVLQGGRDYQVTEEDFDLWKEVLGDREEVSFILYPHLNHIFIAGEGTSIPAEYYNPGNVALEVIDDIGGWIKSW